jgi:hypothetical protein
MLVSSNLRHPDTVTRLDAAERDFASLGHAPTCADKAKVFSKESLSGESACVFTALLRKSLIINGAGEGNRTLVSITTFARIMR